MVLTIMEVQLVQKMSIEWVTIIAIMVQAIVPSFSNITIIVQAIDVVSINDDGVKQVVIVVLVMLRLITIQQQALLLSITA